MHWEEDRKEHSNKQEYLSIDEIMIVNLNPFTQLFPVPTPPHPTYLQALSCRAFRRLHSALPLNSLHVISSFLVVTLFSLLNSP